jgi:hypothetical protein
LKILTRSLDEAISNQKKQDRLRARPPNQQEESEADKDFKSVHSKIKRYKADIAEMKRQLDGSLHQNHITDLENQSRFLTKRIKELEEQSSSLIKIEQNQKRALDNVTSNINFSQRMDALREECREVKDKYRELLNQQKQDEKNLKEQHQACIDLEDKCRKLKGMIKNRKPLPPAPVIDEDEEPALPGYSNSDIDSMKRQIEKLEQKKKDEEAKMKQRIKELESQVRDSRLSIDILNVQLKEKDQELRLNILKIKELKRASNNTKLRTSSKPPKPLPRMVSEKSVQESSRKSPDLNSVASDEKILYIGKDIEEDLPLETEDKNEAVSDVDEEQDMIEDEVEDIQTGLKEIASEIEEDSEIPEEPLGTDEVIKKEPSNSMFSRPFKLR